MSIGYWNIGFAIALLAATSVAAAQDDRRGRRQGANTASQMPAPQSDNPVKRTWDFTKRFGILQYDGRSGCANDTAAFGQLVAEYNDRVNAFLAGPSDAKKLNLERRNYLRQVAGTERDIAAYLATFEETGKTGGTGSVSTVEADQCRARTQRHSLLAIREGLNAMQRVYPDMAEVAPRLAQVNAAIARIGDDRSIASQVGANRSAALAQVRLKPAVARNSAWEAQLRSGFARLVPGETILKLHLYSANWYVHKNELTSYPEYRQIGAWVATRRTDGSCWINGVDLWQDYVGTGFADGEYKLGQAPQQILCENL